MFHVSNKFEIIPFCPEHKMVLKVEGLATKSSYII